MTGYRPESEPTGRGRDGQGGFTLIELMIVVVIVAILAAIAYPSFQQYVRESKRADAHAALTRIAALQEKFFSNNNRYATTTLGATGLGYAAHPARSPDGYWRVTVTNAAGALDFTLTAAPGTGHVDPDCATITLNSAGLRGSAPGECW
jgi:type IV pilus assembly protein PilE